MGESIIRLHIADKVIIWCLSAVDHRIGSVIRLAFGEDVPQVKSHRGFALSIHNQMDISGMTAQINSLPPSGKRLSLWYSHYSGL